MCSYNCSTDQNKTILWSHHGKFSQINKQSDVKFWLNWRKYGAVSYWLSYKTKNKNIYSKFFVASDLWAIGCIIYQMISGIPPFQSKSEYMIFKKIEKLEYSFHEGFDENAKDLVKKLLVIEPKERLGMFFFDKGTRHLISQV